MPKTIGAVTIGQSPRPELVNEITESMGTAALAGDGIVFAEAGALDGLSIEQVRRLAPGSDDYVLVTKMRDGTSVVVAERHILALMQERIDSVVARGADIVTLLCTGEFPPFSCDKTLVVPQKLVFHAAKSVLPQKADELASFRLGVMLPDSGQIPQGEKRWGQLGCKVRVEPASPYEDEAAIEAAARNLRQWGAQIVVMDCIGYTLGMKEQVKRAAEAGVILARSILGRWLAELI